MGRAWSPTPFVGRADSLGTLEDCLARCVDGTTTAVLLAGEAGMGKTRLLTEFASRVGDRADVVRGQCVQTGSGLPYVPVMAALGALTDRLGRDAVARAAGPGHRDLARLIPRLGPPAADSEVGRSRMFEAVTTLLETVSRQHPLVLVVEDLHWADTSTRDLLLYLIRSLDDTRLLLVGSYRSDELHRRHPLRGWLAEAGRSRRTVAVALPPLTRQDVESIVVSLRGGPVSRTLLDDVCTWSDGVPFLVEELARNGRANGGHLRASLRDLLLARTSSLSAAARDVLAAAAIGGERVEHGALVAVLGSSESAVASAIEDALDSGLLVVDGDGYAFRHALVREAVEDEVLPGQRTWLHSRWAEVTESDGSDAAVVSAAHHWYAAHDVPRAFSAALRAADVAGRLYAPEEQARLLARVLDLWSRVDDPETTARCDEVAVLEQASLAFWRAGEPTRAAVLLEAALTRLDPGSDAYAHVLALRAQTEEDAGTPGTERWLGEALSRCPAHASAERARLLRLRANRLVLLEDVTAARIAAAEAVEAAERSGDRRELAAAYRVLAVSAELGGDTTGALALLDRAEAFLDADGSEVDRAAVGIERSAVLFDAGRFSDSITAAHDASLRAAQHGLGRRWSTFLAGNEAYALTWLGRWDEALAIVDRGLRRDPPSVTRLALTLTRATILVPRGDPSAATVVSELESVPPEMLMSPQYRVPVAAIRAMWLIEIGRPEAALRLLVDGVQSLSAEAAGMSGWYALPTLPLAVEAASPSAEDTERALGLVDMIRQAPTRLGMADVLEAVTMAVLADLRRQPAEPAWADAVRAFGAPGVEGPAYWHAYALYRWARALVDAGGERAPAVLEQAADAASALRTDPLLARLTTLARRAHLPVPAACSTRVTHAADQASLTERECEVLALLAEGRTNAQIAERLFISPKTASVHVSHILRKLDAGTRTEAVTVARRQGLVG